MSPCVGKSLITINVEASSADALYETCGEKSPQETTGRVASAETAISGPGIRGRVAIAPPVRPRRPYRPW
jgi:hypothetical protein